ncbi:MAG: hypothetical protein ACD_3C00037G0006 [uncultured bacterium (gcode 4)]|uniref:DUF2231 domain-containing protein n=1 Tax=uncultured bacterium (gcode 4) TaxID=1234023 RepID=K2GYV9_9BACT|nr:MAG: hypothetical protein ACD_3C00037G0006 [uncultured bacterium (gcode 4)]
MITLPNDAHLHLLINHFPIIGTVFGLWLIIFWIYAKNKSIINAAYVFFIISSLTGFVAFYTWGLAANVVVDLEWVSRQALRTHSEVANIVIYGIHLLWIISLFWLYINYKKKRDYLAKYVLVIAIIMTVATSYLWHTWWLIRHTEINIPRGGLNQ